MSVGAFGNCAADSPAFEFSSRRKQFLPTCQRRSASGYCRSARICDQESLPRSQIVADGDGAAGDGRREEDGNARIHQVVADFEAVYVLRRGADRVAAAAENVVPDDDRRPTSQSEGQLSGRLNPDKMVPHDDDFPFALAPACQSRLSSKRHSRTQAGFLMTPSRKFIRAQASAPGLLGISRSACRRHAPRGSLRCTCRPLAENSSSTR